MRPFSGPMRCPVGFRERDGTEETSLRILCRLPSSHAALRSSETALVMRRNKLLSSMTAARGCSARRGAPAFSSPKRERETQPLADQLGNPFWLRQSKDQTSQPGLHRPNEQSSTSKKFRVPTRSHGRSDKVQVTASGSYNNSIFESFPERAGRSEGLVTRPECRA
jgi:hypothetical protein